MERHSGMNGTDEPTGQRSSWGLPSVGESQGKWWTVCFTPAALSSLFSHLPRALPKLVCFTTRARVLCFPPVLVHSPFFTGSFPFPLSPTTSPLSSLTQILVVFQDLTQRHLLPECASPPLNGSAPHIVEVLFPSRTPCLFCL